MEQAEAGEIVAVTGLPEVFIGETIADPDDPRPLPPIRIEAPTVRMTFGVNTSPFTGTEGTWSTSRKLRERLFKELEPNVSLRVQETDSADTFIVSGRGELHLAILIETMRREGYEFQVGKPEVILREENGADAGAGRGSVHRSAGRADGHGRRDAGQPARADDRHAPRRGRHGVPARTRFPRAGCWAFAARS